MSRAKFVGAIIGLAILGLVTGAAANLLLHGRAAFAQSGATVTAQKFVLTDAQGKVRGTLAVEGAKPSVALYDANGKRRLDLCIAQGLQPELMLLDAAGQIRLMTGLYDGLCGGFVATDPQGQVRLAWMSNRDGSCELGLSDAAATAGISLKTDALGQPSLKLTDAQGNVKLSAP